MNKAVKKYYKEVYHAFPTHSQLQKNYLYKFKEFLTRFSQQHPEYQYLDYIDDFGEPQDIVVAYYERVDNQFVIAHMKIAQMLKYTLIFFGTIFLITFICFVYLKYQEHVEFNESSPYYYETILEDDI